MRWNNGSVGSFLWGMRKKVPLILVIALVVMLIDGIVCFGTYYIPSAGLFVHYKYHDYDDEIKRIMKEDPPLRGTQYVRFNLISRHFFSARFGSPKTKNNDWLVMWPPDESGTAYVLNTETEEITLVEGGPYGHISSYQCHLLKVADQRLNGNFIEDIVGSIKVENRIDYIPRECIFIINYAHWLIDMGIYGVPRNSIKKAHLWHLFM